MSGQSSGAPSLQPSLLMEKVSHGAIFCSLCDLCYSSNLSELWTEKPFCPVSSMPLLFPHPKNTLWLDNSVFLSDSTSTRTWKMTCSLLVRRCRIRIIPQPWCESLLQRQCKYLWLKWLHSLTWLWWNAFHSFFFFLSNLAKWEINTSLLKFEVAYSTTKGKVAAACNTFILHQIGLLL